MIKQLNGVQRFCLMFIAAMLATTIAVIAAAWPVRDAAVLADLAAPECQAWRDVPEGRLPLAYPARGEACYALGAFVYEHKLVLRSERDYAGYLRSSGVRNAAMLLAVWAVMAAGGYLLAWSSARSVGALLRRQRPC